MGEEALDRFKIEITALLDSLPSLTPADLALRSAAVRFWIDQALAELREQMA